MVGGVHLTTTGARMPYPMGADPKVTDEMCLLAARHQTRSPRPGTADDDDNAEDQSQDDQAVHVGEDQVLALIAHYQMIDKNSRPAVGSCFNLTVQLKNVPYETWSWTQYANNADKVLPAVAWGTASGPTATLSLQMHGNSFSTLSITPTVAVVGGGWGGQMSLPEGALNDGYPLGVVYDEATKQAVARHACVPGV